MGWGGQGLGFRGGSGSCPCSLLAHARKASVGLHWPCPPMTLQQGQGVMIPMSCLGGGCRIPPFSPCWGGEPGFSCRSQALNPPWLPCGIQIFASMRLAGGAGLVRKRRGSALLLERGGCLPTQAVVQGDLNGFAQSLGGRGGRKRKGENQATQVVVGRLQMAGTVDPCWKSCCPSQK